MNEDIANQQTLKIRAVSRAYSVSSPQLRILISQRGKQFWLRVACIVVIVLIELLGTLGYFSLQQTVGTLIEATATAYPCAHVILYMQNGKMISHTEYACSTPTP